MSDRLAVNDNNQALQQMTHKSEQRTCMPIRTTWVPDDGWPVEQKPYAVYNVPRLDLGVADKSVNGSN